MSQIVLPAHGFGPRDYQYPLWSYRVEREGKRAVALWHRRAGKDILSTNICAVESVRRVGLYWHVLPTYQQGRKIVWDGITGDGVKFTDYFPPDLVVKRRDDQMRLNLVNGSVYQVVGGDQVDRLVGSNPVGVIFSEYSLQNPECWEYIRPILIENKGWAIFIYTARGYNHGFDLYEQARESDDWFCEKLTIEDTFRSDGEPIVTKADIEEELRSGMPEELVRQEYYCDFSAPLVGAYYGKELDEADSEGRISSEVQWRKEHPVYTAWDLGISDAMTIWFFQLVGDYANFIDFYTSSNVGLEHYIKILDSKPYIYKNHYAPHDIRVRELGTGKSRLEVAAKLGIRFRIAPRLSLEDGINATKMFLSRCRFNPEKCEDGLKALRHYTRAYDRKNRIWSARPVHDWSSHAADSFRYAAISVPRSAVGGKSEPLFKRSLTFGDVMESVKESGRRRRQDAKRRRWI